MFLMIIFMFDMIMHFSSFSFLDCYFIQSNFCSFYGLNYCMNFILLVLSFNICFSLKNQLFGEIFLKLFAFCFLTGIVLLLVKFWNIYNTLSVFLCENLFFRIGRIN